MAKVEAQVAVALDSVAPRDRVISVLHFRVAEGVVWGGADYQSLADDLRAIWAGNWGRAPGSQEMVVTVYDLDDPKPRAPHATSSVSVGAAPAATCPREVSLCLSFFADRNLPRNRGRIYLSPAARGLTGLGARPTTQQMNDALAMADAFSSLGGPNVDWSIKSVADGGVFKKVTHAWVDDEWDTQRRRGLKATTRVQHDVSG